MHSDFSLTVCYRTRGEEDLLGQLMGPLVDPAIMTAVMSVNHVDSGSFCSRCCAFRRTHTYADPTWLLCIRLALPLTLSLPSGFAPSERFKVGVPTRALSLAVISCVGRENMCGCGLDMMTSSPIGL